MKGNEKKKQETLYITAGSEENLSGKETEQYICRILTEMEIPFQIMHHPPVYTSADCTEIEKHFRPADAKTCSCAIHPAPPGTCSCFRRKKKPI